MYGITISDDDVYRNISDDSIFSLEKVKLNRYRFYYYSVDGAFLQMFKPSITLNMEIPNRYSDTDDLVLAFSKGTVVYWGNSSVAGNMGLVVSSVRSIFENSGNLKIFFFRKFKHIFDHGIKKPEYGLEIYNDKGENTFGGQVQPMRIIGYCTKNEGVVWYRSPRSWKDIAFIQVGGSAKGTMSFDPPIMADTIYVSGSNIKYGTVLTGEFPNDLGILKNAYTGFQNYGSNVYWAIIDTYGLTPTLSISV